MAQRGELVSATGGMRGEVERYVALAANAHIDRKYRPVGDTVPTIDELESLASRMERLNTEGSTTEFIDAQSEYIDALTVALEWQASRGSAEHDRKVEITDEHVEKGVRALVASWDGTVSTPDDWDLVRSILTAALEPARGSN